MEDMEEELREQALFDERENEKDKLRARIRELEGALRTLLEMPHLCDAGHSPRSCSWCVVVENARTILEKPHAR